MSPVAAPHRRPPGPVLSPSEFSGVTRPSGEPLLRTSSNIDVVGFVATIDTVLERNTSPATPESSTEASVAEVCLGDAALSDRVVSVSGPSVQTGPASDPSGVGMTEGETEQCAPVLGRLDQIKGPEGRIRWNLARGIGFAALHETRKVAAEERGLTGVDNLIRHRRPDGTYPNDVLEAEHINNVTRVKEPAMPFAVSTTFQPYIDGEFYWQRQTGMQVAASGYRYHTHEEALKRADVEVVEAIFAEEGLEPGITSVMLSPRMSAQDASREVAKHEHLADDDSIRIQWIARNSDGTIRGKYVQSILIRSDLRAAWVAMLADPGNIFGKSITVEDPDSALSMMKAFASMQAESEKLPEGVVTLLEATVPYISDTEQQKAVQAMLPEYRRNQQKMQEVAEDVATRWDAFDIALANSLAAGAATPAIVRFIKNLSHQWNDNDLKLFAAHRTGADGFSMSRALAVRLEQAQESVLCAQAALLVGNKRALHQVDKTTAFRIIAEVEKLHHLMRSGIDPLQVAGIEGRATSLTASQDIKTGGGCPGDVKGNFRSSSKESDSGSGQGDESLERADGQGVDSKDKKDKKSKKRGKREWMYCVHCPLCERDGVDAYIDHYPAEKKKRITCCSCKGHVEYPA